MSSVLKSNNSAYDRIHISESRQQLHGLWLSVLPRNYTEKYIPTIRYVDASVTGVCIVVLDALAQNV